MEQAQHIRDLVSLARMLRTCADEDTHQAQHDLFLDTAAVLEHRARELATSRDLAEDEDAALHARVDFLI
jgi:hypothetical protein